MTNSHRRRGSISGGGGGFTLIEMLVVLGLVSVLFLGLAVHLHQADQGFQLQRAADELDVLLHTWSTQAAITHSPWLFQIHPGSRQITVTPIGWTSPTWTQTHELTERIDGVRLDGATLSDRPIAMMIQPSGYLRSFDALLRSEDQQLWVQWDPLISQLRPLES